MAPRQTTSGHQVRAWEDDSRGRNWLFRLRSAIAVPWSCKYVVDLLTPTYPTYSSQVSASFGEDGHQLLRRNNFELCVGAITGLLVEAPATKLRHVAEARTLHVLVCNLNH